MMVGDPCPMYKRFHTILDLPRTLLCPAYTTIIIVVPVRSQTLRSIVQWFSRRVTTCCNLKAHSCEAEALVCPTHLFSCYRLRTRISRSVRFWVIARDIM